MEALYLYSQRDTINIAINYTLHAKRYTENTTELLYKIPPPPHTQYRQGYYTTDVRCVIDTKCNMNMKTAVLHKDVDDISCHCNMVEPEKLGHKIMSCITGTCTLVITRCPVK